MFVEKLLENNKEENAIKLANAICKSYNNNSVANVELVETNKGLILSFNLDKFFTYKFLLDDFAIYGPIGGNAYINNLRENYIGFMKRIFKDNKYSEKYNEYRDNLNEKIK